MVQAFASLVCFALISGFWLWLATLPYEPARSLGIAIGGILGLVPIVATGRWCLNASPDIERANRVTTILHYLFALGLVSATIEATKVSQNNTRWLISIPAWLGFTLMVLFGLVLLLTGLSLSLKGLGLPFAGSYTRLVVTDWVYAWTRNPIIIAALAFLLSLGIWLQSALFILWVLVCVVPVVYVYIRIYEERELEIRFGTAYLRYKERTPRFFPRKPVRG